MSETQNRKNNCRGEKEKGVSVPLVRKYYGFFTNFFAADKAGLLLFLSLLVVGNILLHFHS